MAGGDGGHEQPLGRGGDRGAGLVRTESLAGVVLFFVACCNSKKFEALVRALACWLSFFLASVLAWLLWFCESLSGPP